ncbi:SdpI family protein [Flavobacterium sp. LB3P45]|uniref:SdpI family protein n=1 Tax=Flavobacterium fructosi TaxID=3230416 RepID=A0ABW6HLU4_9FLAO
MKLTLRKELPIIGIILVPCIYLAFLWNSLPEKVPTHWNYKGEIDRWGDKYSLIGLLFLLPVLTYLLLLIIPKIDPKKRIDLMGGKYYQIKFILVLMMSLLSMFIIHLTKNESISNPNLIFALMGILIVVMGNYFKVIQPNYFLGIRTPWTLENKEVWRSTHTFASKLWFTGGLLIIIGGIFLPDDFFLVVFLSIIALIVIVPTVYSYFIFKEIETNK